MAKDGDLLLEIARFIWRQDISINDLYVALGVDLDEHRVDADDATARLHGIMTGWRNAPEPPA